MRRRRPVKKEKEIVDETGNFSCKFCYKNFLVKYLLEEHENVCRITLPSGQDLRTASGRQEFFANQLGLVAKMPAPNPPPPHSRVKVFLSRAPILKNETNNNTVTVRENGRRHDGTMNLRKVPARSKMISFIKANPRLPLSSERGQRFLNEFGEKIKPTEEEPAYEKYCRSTSTDVPDCDFPIKTLQKNLISNFEHTHNYSFGKADRLQNYVTLVLGLHPKNAPLLNKAKWLSLSCDKLSPARYEEAKRITDERIAVLRAEKEEAVRKKEAELARRRAADLARRQAAKKSKPPVKPLRIRNRKKPVIKGTNGLSKQQVAEIQRKQAFVKLVDILHNNCNNNNSSSSSKTRGEESNAVRAAAVAGPSKVDSVRVCRSVREIDAAITLSDSDDEENISTETETNYSNLPIVTVPSTPIRGWPKVRLYDYRKNPSKGLDKTF